MALTCSAVVGLFLSISSIDHSYAQAPAAAPPAAAAPAPAPAPAAPPPSCDASAKPPALENCTPNSGDTAWMMVSTLLVILMTVPGLALFYGGLVRSKNMLSVPMLMMLLNSQ